MLRNNGQPLHNEGNATTLPKGVVVALRWRPLSRPPRRLWVACSECHYSSINEDKVLRGWQESVSTLRRYRCAECSEASA
jgi:hypothetical protein